MPVRHKGDCKICSGEHLSAIDAALVRGESYRSIGVKFGEHHSLIASHSRHTGAADLRERRALASEKRKKRKVRATSTALPADMAMPMDREGVAAMLWAQYLETWSIVEASSDDLKQKNAAIATSRAITADFAKLLGVNVETGVNLTIDRSTTKVMNVLAGLSEDELRALLIEPKQPVLPPGDAPTPEATEVPDGVS